MADISKQPSASFAWWTRVTLALVAMTVAFPGALLFWVSREYSLERSAAYGWLAGGGALCLLLAIVWMCWVCPVLRSSSPRLKYAAMSPRKYLHSLQGPVWVPAAVVLVLIVASIRYVPVSGVSRHVLKALRQTGPAPFVVVFILSLGISLVLHIRVGRRLRRALATAHLCHRCGYDLHATRSHDCSECGEAREDLGEDAEINEEVRKAGVRDDAVESVSA